MTGRAVVTGAAGGIGSAICRRLAADGMQVIATDLEGADRRLDITDHAAAAALAEELGPVDVLVNNAGWDRVMPFLETTPDLWERKGGVIAFTKAVARELARYNVNVNCVCPGPTKTPMLDIFEGERGQKIIEAMVKAVPFRRLAQPGEIAAAVAFLASADAAYITGQTLSVSGGLTMA